MGVVIAQSRARHQSCNTSHPALRVSHKPLSHRPAHVMPAASDRLSADAPYHLTANPDLALSTLRRPDETAPTSHSCGVTSPMSRARFFLAPQHIPDYTTCSSYARALVWLYAEPKACDNVAPVVFTRTLSLKLRLARPVLTISAEPRATFRRSTSVLSP